MRRIVFLGILALILLSTESFLTSPVSAEKDRTGKNTVAVPQATPLLIDDFSYTAGTLLTNNGWAAHSGAGTNAVTVTSPGLTFSGYPSSGIGNAISLTTSGEDDNKLFTTPVTTGALYAAAMINVSASQTTGDYFFHFFVNSSTFYGKVFAKKDAATTNYAFGVARNANAGTGAVFTGFTFAPNVTHLVVVKYTFNTGTANDDTVDLFIDPTPGGAEPAATLSATDFTAADAANIAGIAVRQGTGTAASTEQIDGIRVGTTWASVTASLAPPDANADFDGDGKTDFTAIRGTGSPFAGSSAGTIPAFKSNRDRIRFQAQHPEMFLVPSGQTMYWYTFGSASGAVTVTPWGDAITDTPTPGDFDGDGKDDIAIWRAGAPGVAAFYIFQSSTSTLRQVQYSETGYDPTVVADYDGDGKDDPAVYGCNPGGQCFFTYMGSLNNPSGLVTYIPWGVGTIADNVPDPGDFDGDGKADFCVQRADPNNPAQAQFALLKSNGFGVEFINWGLPSDFVLPGDYDGDGKADFMVARVSGGTLQHFLFTRTGAVRVANWGITGDAPVPGDYDGDGKTDLAVWRPSVTPGQSTFYVYRSTDATVQIVPWGQCATNPCDIPAAGWQVQ